MKCRAYFGATQANTYQMVVLYNNQVLPRLPRIIVYVSPADTFPDNCRMTHPGKYAGVAGCLVAHTTTPSHIHIINADVEGDKLQANMVYEWSMQCSDRYLNLVELVETNIQVLVAPATSYMETHRCQGTNCSFYFR